ncbi:hypothetical protein PF007_g14190 [Phytophthora fragariae]|uniref:Uncharacterized protein n=2 Tax=Phytophthora TaxID=4783 RepID=A0A6A3Q7H8_9STRA|nr:hypothetical protein PR002_g29564 [Phytophthora rubi]KAE9070749.1 hypothetical protein PF007_g26825 [Phytophthora fragariae]KAE9104047.1 hypothetical protein PF007_g14190 [Phytophthora fragariae]KAE9272782.1 hypothetical protein PR003_g30103 [Phytophthora rubi]KAE9336274.1 hypothetical protein PF008_g13091 [Phytophthora fragariae]
MGSTAGTQVLGVVTAFVLAPRRFKCGQRRMSNQCFKAKLKVRD